ncbi:hypothetical protein [Desulfocurvus sp. DL9XJH121]
MSEATVLQTMIEEFRQELRQATERIVASNEKAAASNRALAQAIKEAGGGGEGARPAMMSGGLTDGMVFFGHINRTE